MVEVNGVGLENVGAAGRSRVNVLVDLPGVEWCVVVFTDGEGDCVGGRWLEANASAHHVLRECLLCVVSKMKASTTSSTSKGHVAVASSARRSGVVDAGAIVGRRHCFGYVDGLSRGFY